MTDHDYRVIMTIAASMAKPTYCEGKLCYFLDFQQFIKAIENIYPDIAIPVSINGVMLNPKSENMEEAW